MNNYLLSGLGILIIFIAYDFSLIPVPDDAVDTFPVRWFLYKYKLIDRKCILWSLVFGHDRYLCWIDNARTLYVPRSRLIENDIEIYESKFGGVPVRIYEPLRKVKNGPAVIWIHGGGWIIGSVDAVEAKCRQMATDLNMVIVSIEYRLAPEHPYPIPFQDCVDATIHFLNNANAYGVDANRIAISGSSAGGNLATAVTLKLRDIKLMPPLKLQLLIYPVTQSLDLNLPSYKQYENEPFLHKELMAVMWLYYATGGNENFKEFARNGHITEEARTKLRSLIDYDSLPGATIPDDRDANQTLWEKLKPVMLDPYFAPLMAENLSNLPMAFVYTCEQDVLRDDGILYAQRLKLAGNSVEYYHNMAGFHGLNAHGNFSQDQIVSDKIMYDFIKKHL